MTEPKDEADRSYRASLANLRNELQMPVNAVIEYSGMLLEDAGEQGQERFISDLRKIHALGKKLLLLVDDSLDDAKIDTAGTGKELEDFSANLRHELRTPLNAIIGYTEMLLEDAQEHGPRGFIPDLEKIRSAGRLFLSFIEEIACFTRSRKSKYPASEPSDASDMVRTVMSDIPPIKEGRYYPDTVIRGNLLVVDDNEINRDLICRQLERQGHMVTAAENGRQAMEIMQTQAFDMVLLDIMMPEMSGYQMLQRLKSSDLHRDVPVIVISALDEMDSVVGCIQMGADDYLLKPFNPVLLKARIRMCLENKRLRELSEALELRNLKEEVQFIAESRAMQQVLGTMRAVCRSPVNVLIHGESGTGKEVIARMIHQGSDRKDKPFVAVNCASVPENLMESEFFGYEKGAFTGAIASRGGRFEEADGGTLFLDEIGDMTLVMQPKFLRVIQEGEGSRLGSNKLVRYDLRIISASNKDLRDEVEKGRFREDLFYRIFSVEIFIPPLRERWEDIVPLTLFFMNRVSRRFKKKVKGFSPELLNFFEEYPWPGNVRQLLHEVEHMVALTPEGERISLKHSSSELQKWRNAAPLTVMQSQPTLFLPQRVEELEIACIRNALLKTKGNKLQASKLLGITRQGLDKKLKRYMI
ncbi:MAG: sigma 54-interacting transcriptional regulator [Nitrospirae bacterium]|nr:sigma 54-interacting transcriptional regulator [Nitrospirota bacterium]